jgi:hypothetical protein
VFALFLFLFLLNIRSALRRPFSGAIVRIVLLLAGLLPALAGLLAILFRVVLSLIWIVRQT